MEEIEMRKRIAILSLWILALAVPQASQLWAQAEKKAAPPAAPEPTFKVGETFPDFTLYDQKRNKVSLHDFKGKKNVAVAFVVFAFTGG